MKIGDLVSARTDSLKLWGIGVVLEIFETRPNLNGDALGSTVLVHFSGCNSAKCMFFFELTGVSL